MAAPTFHGVGTNPADNSSLGEPQTGASLTPPASMLAGDLVVIRLVNENGSAGDGLALNHLGGQTWTSDTTSGSYSYTGAAAGHRVYWCTFNGTWTGGNPTFDLPSKSGNRGGSAQILVFRPDSTSKVWALDTAPSWAGFSAPSTPFTVTVTGITPVNADTVTLAGWCSDDDNTWGSLSGTGWSNTGLAAQYRNPAGSDISTTYAYNLKGAPSATNNVSQNQATLGGDAGSTFIISFYATNPSAPVTGNEATGSVGSVAPSASLALSGNAATGSVGNLTASASYGASITGNAATGSVGSLAPSAAVALSGNQATSAEGSIAPSVSVALSGNLASGAEGSLAPQGVVVVPISGNEATAATGSVAPSVSVALSGNSAAAAVSSLSTSGDAVVALSGNEATGSVGFLAASSSGGGLYSGRRSRTTKTWILKDGIYVEDTGEQQEAPKPKKAKTETVRLKEARLLKEVKEDQVFTEADLKELTARLQSLDVIAANAEKAMQQEDEDFIILMIMAA